MNYLKYLVYTMVLYLLFSFIPKNKVILLDLLTIITILIIFNITYELLELSITKISLEGFEPNYGKNLFSEINPDESNIESNLIESETKDNTLNKQSSNYDNNLIESEIKDNTLNKQNSNNDNNLIKLEDETLNDNTKLENNNEITPLETSTNNYTSLVLSEEDTNKKDKIKYNDKINEIKNEFVYGYSYMHTDYWSIPEKREPICKNLKPCKICPRQTNGFKKDLMKWNIVK